MVPARPAGINGDSRHEVPTQAGRSEARAPMSVTEGRPTRASGHDATADSVGARNGFRSILFAYEAPACRPSGGQAPAHFADLNLDQVVASVTRGRQAYHLEPFFWAPLQNVDAVAYRHEVFRDLEHEDLSRCVRAFGAGMRTMREQLAQADELRYPLQQQRWFLAAAGTYCESLSGMAADLDRLDVRSRGLTAFGRYLTSYIRSPDFIALHAETTELMQRLAKVSYGVHIRGGRVTVRDFDGEADYSRDVQETFRRFRQGAARDYRAKLVTARDMNHVEAAVLDGIAQLHRELFTALARYCERHRDYLDETIGTFDREVQFYVAYLEHVKRLEAAGLRFCYPGVSDVSKELEASETFDLALADKLVTEGSEVVCNGLYLNDPERVIVVSGPNQGGKTTFARTFGQLHHLAGLGCLVPGSSAQLFLPDAVFTHFEREEDSGDLSGKLQADLQRVHEILERATPRSIVIMNEIFSSTTVDDALFLARKVLEKIIELDLLCVCVTFIDELASVSDSTVSMVSTIVPDDPGSRTYKIERRPADGLAYAAVIAEKYALTYEALKARIPS